MERKRIGGGEDRMCGERIRERKEEIGKDNTVGKERRSEDWLGAGRIFLKNQA